MGESANKTDNRTVSYKHRTKRIIPYPTVEEKHIWQVYETSELKIELFCFFTIGTMAWIFIVVKNRYLNFLALLKFAMTQNVPEGAGTN